VIPTLPERLRSIAADMDAGILSTRDALWAVDLVRARLILRRDAEDARAVDEINRQEDGR
jgi:hypothetical protein